MGGPLHDGNLAASPAEGDSTGEFLVGLRLEAGYQFSNGNIAGSFPRNGMEWSFDYLDAGSGSTIAVPTP